MWLFSCFSSSSVSKSRKSAKKNTEESAVDVVIPVASPQVKPAAPVVAAAPPKKHFVTAPQLAEIITANTGLQVRDNETFYVTGSDPLEGIALVTFENQASVAGYFCHCRNRVRLITGAGTNTGTDFSPDHSVPLSASPGNTDEMNWTTRKPVLVRTKCAFRRLPSFDFSDSDDSQRSLPKSYRASKPHRKAVSPLSMTPSVSVIKDYFALPQSTIPAPPAYTTCRPPHDLPSAYYNTSSSARGQNFETVPVTDSCPKAKPPFVIAEVRSSAESYGSLLRTSLGVHDSTTSGLKAATVGAPQAMESEEAKQERLRKQVNNLWGIDTHASLDSVSPGVEGGCATLPESSGQVSGDSVATTSKKSSKTRRKLPKSTSADAAVPRPVPAPVPDPTSGTSMFSTVVDFLYNTDRNHTLHCTIRAPLALERDVLSGASITTALQSGEAAAVVVKKSKTSNSHPTSECLNETPGGKAHEGFGKDQSAVVQGGSPSASSIFPTMPSDTTTTALPPPEVKLQGSETRAEAAPPTFATPEPAPVYEETRTPSTSLSQQDILACMWDCPIDDIVEPVVGTLPPSEHINQITLSTPPLSLSVELPIMSKKAKLAWMPPAVEGDEPGTPSTAPSVSINTFPTLKEHVLPENHASDNASDSPPGAAWAPAMASEACAELAMLSFDVLQTHHTSELPIYSPEQDLQSSIARVTSWVQEIIEISDLDELEEIGDQVVELLTPTEGFEGPFDAAHATSDVGDSNRALHDDLLNRFEQTCVSDPLRFAVVTDIALVSESAESLIAPMKQFTIDRETAAKQRPDGTLIKGILKCRVDRQFAFNSRSAGASQSSLNLSSNFRGRSSSVVSRTTSLRSYGRSTGHTFVTFSDADDDHSPERVSGAA